MKKTDFKSLLVVQSLTHLLTIVTIPSRQLGFSADGTPVSVCLTEMEGIITRRYQFFF